MLGRTRPAGAALLSLLLLLGVGCAAGAAGEEAIPDETGDTEIRDGVTILTPVDNEVVGQRFTVEIDAGDIDSTGSSVAADAGGSRLSRVAVSGASGGGTLDAPRP